MQSVMDLKSKYERVIIVRSLIPTREIGFLPGIMKRTSLHYIRCRIRTWCSSCLRCRTSSSSIPYTMLIKGQGTLFFLSTSFLRGLTFDNSIVIVDECQNMNFHELDTIITRVGQDSRIVFCGDFDQTDLT